MTLQQIIKFTRFTCQGISIASFGTIGVNPTWSGFVEALGTLFAALALMALEKKEN